MKKFRIEIIFWIVLSISFIFFMDSSVFALSGKAVFKSSCVSCHTINGVGGKVGPNLSKIGSKRSIAWLKIFIQHPSKYFDPGNTVQLNGKSYIAIMPPFSRTLSKSKLNALTSYLESLK